MAYEQIEAIAACCPYTLHMIWVDYESGEQCGIRTQTAVASASLIKVPILSAVLAKVHREKRSLTEILPIAPSDYVEFSVVTEQQLTSITLLEALSWMMMTSDNTATNVCIRYVGMDACNAYFTEQGWHATTLRRYMMDTASRAAGIDNTTSAADCAAVFTALYNGDLLNGEMNAIALDLLCKQRHADCLRRYIAEDIVIAHKTGELDDVVHDAGIFYLPHRHYFLAILLTDVKEVEEAKQYIGRLSKAIYAGYKEEGR